MTHIVDLRPGRTPQRAKRSAAPPPSKKPLPLRARRRRARLAWALAALAALAALVYGVHWLSYLPRLTISSITVNGAHAIPVELIEQYADAALHDGSYHFISRSNIFFYPKAALARGIVADFPGIRFAAVGRDSVSSQRLSIDIEERQPFAQWCEGMNCYVLDDAGFIYAAYEASSTPSLPNSYVFSGALASSSTPIGQTFVPGHMPGIVSLLTILQQQTGFRPQTIAVDGDQDLTVHFTDGFDLKVSFGADPATLVRNLRLVLASEALEGKEADIEYVDLRFGDRVFYKLKGKDQEAAE